MILYVLAAIGLVSLGLFSLGVGCASAALSHYVDPWMACRGDDVIVDMEE